MYEPHSLTVPSHGVDNPTCGQSTFRNMYQIVKVQKRIMNGERSDDNLKDMKEPKPYLEIETI